ncbi:MAG: TAT-variant-translocated molybdopterin oxidoreductase [Solitalea-like symbiont of Tyrophagus putrescentiae]
MKEKETKYWQSIEQKNAKEPITDNLNTDKYQGDVPVEEILAEASNNSKGIDRRDFLKTLGFSTAAVTLAACNRAPVRKAVSFFTKPEEITPGIPTYYATYNPEGYSILVKTIEGRPIKIEGNPDCPLVRGGVGVHGQACVLDLYDDSQLKAPILQDIDANWASVDNYVTGHLKHMSASGKEIALVTPSIHGPAEKQVISEFLKKYPTAKHIIYDNISYSAIINANKNIFGEAFIPKYNIENIGCIVSFNADFLNTWLTPIAFSKQYSTNRSSSHLQKHDFKHIQFESIMSVTGSNADLRIPIKPSQEGPLLVALYNEIAKAKGKPVYKISIPKKYKNIIRNTAKDLLKNDKNSVVFSSQNDVSIQIIANNINALLGAYENSRIIDINTRLNIYQGNDTNFFSFLDRANKGLVGAAIFYSVNPVYTFKHSHNGKPLNIDTTLSKVPVKIALTDRLNETANLCNVVALTPHFLSSWNDAEPVTGTYMFQQPTIAPIYNSRQAQESLLTWSDNKISYYDYLSKYWEQTNNDKSKLTDYLQTGVLIKPVKANKTSSVVKLNQDASLAAFNIVLQKQNSTQNRNIEVILYQSTAMRDGAASQANNPMLQELPDPISKITWDNYIAISPQFAKTLSLKEGDIAAVSVSDTSIELPVAVQPGQAYGTISIALGYGRTHVGHVGNQLGKNAYNLIQVENGTIKYHNFASIKKVSGIISESYIFAKSQTEMSANGRDVVRETTRKEYLKNPKAGNISHVNLISISEKDANGVAKINSQNRPELESMWSEHERKGLHWGMAIDLNLCTGCSACVISCNIENNVAVVGRDEVRRRREMHWLRIDRYYSNTPKNSEDYIEDEDNVEVIYQPMMCQHCDHAPCETVCPVLATMHSSEGLNQMVYNRCFGTRYCANNCPYKVRRFNWFNYADNDKFDYHMNNDLGKLVLNPEVTVRSRGVMEKCSMCVQRIQAGKLKAKLENRPIKDGDIYTACSQSCPSEAIIFGDVNDPDSRVHKLLHNPRTFYVLEELNIQPGMGYLTKVRNKVK